MTFAVFCVLEVLPRQWYCSVIKTEVMCNWAMLQLRELVAGLLPWRPGVEARALNVEFMVYEAALDLIFKF